MSIALTDLATVRAYLQKKTADTDQDAAITALIPTASAAIQGWCEREFTPTTSAQERTFEVEIGRETFLSLAPYDARTITTVKIDTDYANPVTLTANEWRAAPQPQRDGVFTSLRLQPFTIANPGYFRRRQVKVTADWGFPSIPDDVKQACTVTVSIWLGQQMSRNAPSLLADEQGAGQVPPTAPGQIPPGALRMLARFKRSSV